MCPVFVLSEHSTRLKRRQIALRPIPLLRYNQADNRARGRPPVGTQYNMVLIFFIYGLAFFSMGLAITLEANRGSDARLRHGLRALAIFGLLHGIHEWVDMFERLDMLPGHEIGSRGMAYRAHCHAGILFPVPRRVWGHAPAARQELSPRQHPGPYHLGHNLGCWHRRAAQLLHDRYRPVGRGRRVDALCGCRAGRICWPASA